MQAAQAANPVGSDEIWAILKSVSESQKETERIRKETECIMKEAQKEAAKRQEKLDRQIDALNRQMGGLHNSFGEMAEHLVAPGVVERFNSLGYHFDGIADRGYKILDTQRNLKTEIDILLENGDYIIAVEVKSDVKEKDLDHHIRRLEILREHRDKHKDPRKICGAIAGAVFYPNIKEMALAKGFYVLEQSGDTMKMDIPKDFKPKEW